MNTKNFNLSKYLKEKKYIIEEYLNKILLQFDQQRELVKAMRHSLMAGGKRLRPILAIAAVEAVGGDFRLSIPVACAIEMIHTYSLIHDDLPAMDNDDLRRGIPTCHKAFSEATAILAGDALLTHAFTIVSKPEQIKLKSNQDKFAKSEQSIFEVFPDKLILLELVNLISDAAGVDGMVEGQMMDMAGASFTNNPLPSSNNLHLQSKVDSPFQSGSFKSDISLKMDYLKRLHHLKTGRMIIASVQAGAISVGVMPNHNINAKEQLVTKQFKNLTNRFGSETFNLLTLYAENIGLAFQVTDDILNVEGDPSIMGKAAGSDRLNDKLTFPTLLGLEESKKFAAQLVDGAIESLSMLPLDFQERSLPLKAIAQYILNRNK
ncbi:MAG: polyprenyl synthetase family protein [Desulfamplus sp.]|nr:polyprenyl synthetase family protein [Desulfamplus sp.]